MLYIDKNIRIVNVDEYCYSYEILKEVDTKKEGKKMKWIPSRLYYGTIEQALNGVKQKVLKEIITYESLDIPEFIKKIEKLNNTLIDFHFYIKE